MVHVLTPHLFPDVGGVIIESGDTSVQLVKLRHRRPVPLAQSFTDISNLC